MRTASRSHSRCRCRKTSQRPPASAPTRRRPTPSGLLRNGIDAMAHIDGFGCAVPLANRDAYREPAERTALMIRRHRAIARVACRGDDVPDGEVTSFPMAVKLVADEVVVFLWIRWPSRAIRDAAWPQVMTEMQPCGEGDAMPFDGQRMIYGGFGILADARPGPISTATPRNRVVNRPDPASGSIPALFLNTLCYWLNRQTVSATPSVARSNASQAWHKSRVRHPGGRRQSHNEPTPGASPPRAMPIPPRACAMLR